MAMFKTHENHIPEIEVAIEKHGEIWFHGDGNIYHKDSPISSDNAVKYAQSPPGRPQRPGPASYRIRLDRNTRLPESKEQLDEMLINGMAADMNTSAKPKPSVSEKFSLGKIQYKAAFPGQQPAAAVAVKDKAEPKQSADVAALMARLDALESENAALKGSLTPIPEGAEIPASTPPAATKEKAPK